MPHVAQGAPLAERPLFWEMQDQTAMRKGRWKLVLNGRLVEGAPPEDDVHLADIVADMGERHNLRDEEPEVAAALTAEAQAWRAQIESRWQQGFSTAQQGTVTHAS
jgi:arylsulfatase A-like enzyme